MAELVAAGVFVFLLNEFDKQDEKRFNALELRKPSEYSQEVNNILKIITTNSNIFPVGSYKYKIHKYPGDIDIFETLKSCCLYSEARFAISKKIQKIAKKILKQKNIFLGDFKAGIDSRLEIYIGKTKQNKVIDYDRKLIKRKIDNLKSQNLLTQKEYNKILKFLKININITDWEKLKKFINDKYIIRWDIDEIIKGQKKLRGNKILYLDEAISHDTVCKIDIWAQINNRYIEITNWFLIVQKKKDGSEKILGMDLGDYISNIEEDIYKYSSKEHRNSLKTAKRLFNKYKFLNKTKNDKYAKKLTKLSPLFSSDMAKLSQITSESEVLRFLLEKIENPPRKNIVIQINEFFDRISDVTLSFNKDEIKEIISKINSTKNSSKIINYLIEFEKIIDNIVEINTFEWMRKEKFLLKSFKNEPLKKISGIPKKINIDKLQNFIHKDWKKNLN